MTDSGEEKTIGQMIAEARKNAGLSLRDLSAKLEIHFTYLADIEKNNRKPSEKILLRLSEQSELNLDLDTLMAGSGRLGSETDRYLREHPSFGNFIRLVVRENLTDSQLTSLSQELPAIIQKIKNPE